MRISSGRGSVISGHGGSALKRDCSTRWESHEIQRSTPRFESQRNEQDGDAAEETDWLLGDFKALSPPWQNRWDLRTRKHRSPEGTLVKVEMTRPSWNSQLTHTHECLELPENLKKTVSAMPSAEPRHPALSKAPNPGAAEVKLTKGFPNGAMP